MTTHQSRNTRKFPQPDKGSYKKTIAYTLCNGERLNDCLLRAGTRQGHPFPPVQLDNTKKQKELRLDKKK